MRVGRHAHGRRHPQATVLVLAAVRKLAELDDVTVGDESHQLAVGVDDGQLFDAVFAKDLLRLAQVAPVLRHDEVLRRHQLGNGALVLLFEA